jgi:Phage integrase family
MHELPQAFPVVQTLQQGPDEPLHAVAREGPLAAARVRASAAARRRCFQIHRNPFMRPPERGHCLPCVKESAPLNGAIGRLCGMEGRERDKPCYFGLRVLTQSRMSSATGSGIGRSAPTHLRTVRGSTPSSRAAAVEAKWLEVPDAALLLEAARTYRPAQADGGRPPIAFAYELLATLLLTGGRESEVLGLEVDDVSLERGVVTFRPNPWRRLKTATSHRSVSLWPQLREILKAYFPRREREPGSLLFPSFRTGEEAMITDFRKVLDAIALRAGWALGEIRSKMFRHTYCAARLQTVDRGAAISPFTVSREMDHGVTTSCGRSTGTSGRRGTARRGC